MPLCTPKGTDPRGRDLIATLDQHSILSKTAKGLAAATGKTSQLSRALRKLLKGIDGRTPIADLAEKFTKIPEAELLETLEALEQEGFVREQPRAGVAAPDEGEDLDFTAIAGPPVAQPPDDSAAREVAAARAEAETTALARAEGAAAAWAQAEAQAASKAKADAEAAAKAEARRAEAAALVRAHHETNAKQAAEAKAKAEAEAAELRSRLEEERKAREELERKANEDAERAVREAQEWARRQAEERAHREAEERAQREAAERAGREAALREAKQHLEAEESARQQAVEQARREAEELRVKLETERKAREDAERRAREESQHRPPATTDFPRVTIAEPAVDEAQVERAMEERAQEVAQRFQEEQAKRASERQAQREETERKRAVEEAALRAQARAAEEAKRKLLQEEEERRRAAEEAERSREEEKARASDETLRKVRLSADAAMRARQRATEEELATEQQRRKIPAGVREAQPAAHTPRRARRRGRIAAILFLLVVGAFSTAHFMPLDAGSYEREATARFGTPVKIGSAHLSLLPMPVLRFERVSIGPAGEVQIAAVSSPVGVGAIFDKRNALKTLELDGVQIPASWLGAAIWGKGRSDAFRVERVRARGVRVEAPELELPVLTVDAKLDSGGALQSLSAQTADKNQKFNLTMTDGKATVDISARAFRLPFRGALQLDGLVGSGTLTPSELTLRKFELGAFGGSVKGNARVRWGASWSVEGDFTAASMNPRLATASLVLTGRLEGKGTFSMRAPTPDKLHEATRIDATFNVKSGTLGFVDLTRALQGGNTRGGTTWFASLDGNASFGGGSVRLTQLRLAAGLLNATGEATVDPRKNLNGRLRVDLASETRGVLTLAGAVAAPQVKR